MTAMGVRYGLATPAEAAGKTGRELLQAMIDGLLPAPPICETLSFRLVEVGDGFAAFEGEPSRHLLNPMGGVHGGWALTLIDSACGCAAHSLLPAGASYATVETKGNLSRPIPTDMPRVRCEGRVISRGRQVISAEARVLSPDRKVLAPRHLDSAGAPMSDVRRHILECIGNTPLVALRHIPPKTGARILLKLESENPTGSMKDRMALAMIEAAEVDGRLNPGGSVVEYTGGSTGVSLSLVCAVKRHPLHIVTSDAFTREKLDHMRLLGARLTIVPSDAGRMTEKLTRDMIEKARVITAESGAFWTDQLNNSDQLRAYDKLADEIWTETGGAIDGYVQSVGTAASLRGTAEALRRRKAGLRVVAIEPTESPVLSGGTAGAHKIDGIGVGFVPPLWRDGVADTIERVSTADATDMALRLAREEGIFAGTSTGANVTAALRLAEQLGPGSTIVTIMCDTGMKYLKTFGALIAAA